MPAQANRIFPCMYYHDAHAAIDWLAAAFGFEASMVVPGDDGTIVHAELTCGSGAVMIGSVKDNAFGMKTPRQLGGITHSIYIVVSDADAHYTRAKAHGAEIVMELKDTDYGSRDYSARDPEGYLWNFGTYLPEYAAGS